MTCEYFEDLLNQLGVDYSIEKNSIYFKTPSEQNTENVEIELSEYEFNTLFRMAHEENITFNQFCNKVLKEHFDKIVE
jgi:hypothetical protein